MSTSTDVHGHHKLEENLSVLKDDGRQGQAYGRMAGDGDGRRRFYALRVGGLWPSSTLLGTLRRTPHAVSHTPMLYAPRKNKKEIAIFHYKIWFP
jgi:hypothetical protein